MDNGRSYLALDVVTDDGQASLGKLFLPLRIAGNKDGDTVDERAACGQDLLDVEAGGLFAANGQVIDHHIRLCIPKEFSKIHRLSGRFVDQVPKVSAQAVERGAAHHRHAEIGHVAEFD